MPKSQRRIVKVNSRRNSTCGSAALSELDFANWFTDCGVVVYTKKGGGLTEPMMYCYLHVDHKKGSAYAGTHRVHCRVGDNVRLMLKNGELYWIIDNDDIQVK